MSKFTKSIARTYSFDEDTVTVVMDRLKKKDLIHILPYLGSPDDDGNVKLSFEQSLRLLDEAGDVIKKRVRSIEGLKIASEDLEGGSLIDTVFDNSYFMELLGQMLGDLVSASFSGKTVEKKSDVLPGGTSQSEAEELGRLEERPLEAYPSTNG